jgi:hypothetical protein
MQSFISREHSRLALLSAGLLVCVVLAVAQPGAALGASSKGCDGGGFAVTLGDGSTLRGAQSTTVAASRLGSKLQVRGRYVGWDIDPATFAVFDYAFTGAANPLDMTGGKRIVAFASKVPDLRGLVLSGPVQLQLDAEGLLISRAGSGISMKLQANDCAQGGIFQMEPQRADGTSTRITHTLGAGTFYFDNPNFRAREGDVVPFKDTTVQVAPRINFTSDASSRFVGRDSPQVATRVLQGCLNTVPAPRHPGGTASVDHCGGVSVWDVASGGRMGGVFGEDSTEVAPPSSLCTHQCQAQDQVRGQSVVLGFPFPVPDPSRLVPRFPG